jgi:hypothetical protein
MIKGRWRWVAGVAGVVLCALAGCGKKSDPGTAAPAGSSPAPAAADPAATFLASYLATPCMARLPFITNPDGDRAAFEEKYKGLSCKQKYESLDTSDCKAPADDGYCYPLVVWGRGKNAFGVEGADSVNYCMQQTPQGFKIDWRCSLGYNPVTVPAFRTQHAFNQPAVFRMRAKLSYYYNYEFSEAKQTHYSLSLEDKEFAHIDGAYVPRQSADGQKLFDVLKDGKEHTVVIELVYRPNSQDSSVATVTRLLGFGWRERPAEYVARAPSESASTVRK